MGAAGIWSVINAYDAGQTHITSWRKVPTQTTASGIWFDLSMSPGNPVPNYYASTPAVFVPLSRSEAYGINHGPAVSPKTKHLKMFSALTTTATAAPLLMILCDYLGYAPFLDMSIAGGEFQPISNTSGITRSVSGAGVRIMAVEVASQIGGSQFYVTYTNQAGVVGRVTSTATCNTQVVNGTIISSAPATSGAVGPFLALQGDDTGVRSIQGITFLNAGDVGLVTLVLVKPLYTHAILGIDAPTERDFVGTVPLLPIIDDDAYLNLICHPVGTLVSAQIMGMAEFVWM